MSRSDEIIAVAHLCGFTESTQIEEFLVSRIKIYQRAMRGTSGSGTLHAMIRKSFHEYNQALRQIRRGSLA